MIDFQMEEIVGETYR